MNPSLPTPNLPELTTPPSGGWGAPSCAGFPSPGRVSAGAPALPVIDFVGSPAPIYLTELGKDGNKCFYFQLDKGIDGIAMALNVTDDLMKNHSTELNLQIY